MRETRPSGSEGGATELNQSFLPLSFARSPATFATSTPTLSQRKREKGRASVLLV